MTDKYKGPTTHIVLKEDDINKARVMFRDMEYAIKNKNKYKGSVTYQEYRRRGLFKKKLFIVSELNVEGKELPSTLYWPRMYQYTQETEVKDGKPALGESGRGCKKPEPKDLGIFVEVVSKMKPGDSVIERANIVTAFRDYVI